MKKLIALVFVSTLLAAPFPANAWIYSGDAQCDRDAYNYAWVMTHGHPESPFFEGYHDGYELENCPGAGIDP